MICLKRFKKALSVLLTISMLFGFSAFPVDAVDKVEFSADMSRVLQSGYYVVDGMFMFYGDDTNVNGLEIAAGATVCIEITEGSVLTVQGRDAYGTAGAGAGIYVPVDSTLIVRGSGTLKATGGNAANGKDGYDGGDGQSRINGSDEARGGAGGMGGNGGGGAGAGIGGMGGKGGMGGIGGFGAHVKDEDDYYWFYDGNPGQYGEAGGSGVSMGTVILNSDVDFDINGGKAGKDGESGKFGKHSLYDATGTLYDYSYGAGGGAGGGGKGGNAAVSVGGGGAGGMGAGGGGGGGAMCNDFTSAPGAGDDPHSEAGSGCGGGYDKQGNLVQPTTMYWDEGVNIHGGMAGWYSGSGVNGKNGKFAVHTHDFSNDWSYNETTHWHICTADDCDIALAPGIDYSNCGESGAAYGEHQWSEGKCSVCGFDGFMIDENNIAVKYCGPGGDITVPDGVVCIDSNVLQGGTVTGVTLSTSVIVVDEEAFSGAELLSKLDLSTVMVIGDSAFEGCASLDNVRIPSSVISIGEEAFKNCNSLTTITVEWTNAEEIIIPPEDAFAGITENQITLRVPVGTADLYKEVNVWRNFNIVDDHDHSFDGTWKYNYYNHWHPCKEPGCSIKDYSSCDIDEAAYGRHNWQDDACTECGYVCPHIWSDGKCTICGKECIHTWKNGRCTTCYIKCAHDWQNAVCTNCGFDGFVINDTVLEEYSGPLEEVTVPETVTKIGYHAFKQSSAKKVILPETVTALDKQAFEDNRLLEEIFIPESVREMSVSAFSGCIKLKSVKIPGQVRLIDINMFRECESLESVTIPRKVEYIFDHAFLSCESLKDIYVDWIDADAFPMVDDMAFAHVDISSVRLHVPEGKGGIYEKDAFWGQFIVADPLDEAKTDALDAIEQAKAGCISEEAASIFSSAITQIKSAETVAEVNDIKQNALSAAGIADGNLLSAWNTAADELSKIKEGYQSDAAKTVIDNGIKTIKGTLSVNGVAEALNSVKKEAAVLENALSDAKFDAKEKLENAKSRLVSEDYIASVDDALGKVENATGVESVSEYEVEGLTAFENAIADAKKKAVDKISSGLEDASGTSAVIADLAEKAIDICETEQDIIDLTESFSSAITAQQAKEEAIERLSETADECVSDEAKEILSAAAPKIIGATDADSVNAVLNNALDAAEEAERALSEAKAQAKEELADAKASAVSEEAKLVCDNAEATVDSATSVDAVGKVKTAVLNDMAAADNALENAKVQAKSAVDKALGGEPTGKAKDAAAKAKSEIDKADSVSKVKVAQTEGEKNVAEGQKICDYCGKEHKNIFDNIACFFIKLFSRITSLFSGNKTDGYEYSV